MTEEEIREKVERRLTEINDKMGELRERYRKSSGILAGVNNEINELMEEIRIHEGTIMVLDGWKKE